MSKRKINYHPVHILRNKPDRAILMVCIGVAFIFWVGTKMSERYDTSMRIALQFLPPSPRTILAQSPPQALEVTLEGTGWQLAAQALKRKPLMLTYELSADTQQVFRLQQLTRDVRAALPSDIQITTITPELIPLQLDVKSTRVVPIELPYRLHTAEQFVQADAIALRPDSVALTGPASILRDVKVWYTDTLVFEGLTQSVEGVAPLSAFPNGQVTFQPQALTYRLPVEQLTEKTLQVPIQVDAPDPTQWRIFPDQVSITCNVPLSQYELLQKADIQITIRPTAQRRSASLRVMRLPATVQAYRLAQDSVRVYRYDDDMR